MSKEDHKSIFFGLFLCAGILGLFSVMLFTPKSRGDGKQEIHVAFTHLSGVSKGMNVCLAGKIVGSVASVQNIMDRGICGKSGELYCYELVLKIDSGISLYKEDTFAMYSPKIIGESIVNIIPGKIRDESHRLYAQDLVCGQNIDPIEKLIQFVDRADKALEKLEAETTHLYAKIATLLDEEKDTSLVKQARLATESIHKSADRLADCLDSVRVERIDGLMEDCKDITSAVKDYGLLYQYSSRWKKQRRAKDKKQSLEQQGIALENK
ncbi:MlaD family protein [Chlamydia caviae]|uniref:ABC transporter, periplasmic substrate-binding protein, putative n=1 Tax=Chlamydia caviae (strain ATCC VR-813 / DSM 19441 / 03DC25 / GPIC) TaxID=227941 RepID=Q822Q3_CHLCV|nr:MCE family protein [Chlamydia caviae]AAP05368.1 ABC transporter, periplasmic substrate-binding protein, putative [Chlamydia caviae GPIC]